jgi:nicotinamide mononucleotide adenylyltransferase
MAGISYLYEEYKKDPKRIEKLLEEKIEITEKLDGSRFLAQAVEGGSLIFFKRKDMSISKIDRTLSKYYEKAIDHFENFNEEKIAQLPEGWRFGMEYFPNLQPVTISYDRLPLNNLVLTDIQVKDPRDKTIDVITDRETLNKWADILEVERPPIIFEGNLTSAQKGRILDFLNTPYEHLIKRFKTENFTDFILKLLNPQLKSSFLNNSTDKDIDGLIFKFDGKESFRVSNPEVALSKSERKEEKPSDIYNLTLVILQEFLMGLDFKKIKLKEKTYEERYIEFISKVFNLFLQSPQYIKNFEKGVDFELPKFLTRAESNVNFKFVKDPETLSALEKSSTNRELFKILMASMRSHKKRPSGFFSKELIFHHNKLVDKIADYVGSKEGVKAIEIKEASFVSFQEFKKVFLTESSTWQEEFGKEAPEEESQLQIFETSAEVVSLGDESQEPLEVVSFPTYSEVVKEEEISRPLEVLKKIATSSQEPQNKKRTSICLMMGKFQPFHNGHLSCIEDAAEASGCKIFIVVTTKRLPENGITRDLHYSMLKDVLEGNKKVSGIVFSNGRSVREVINDLPKTYDVKSFAGSEDECEDIRTQISGIEVFPMTKHLSSKTVFQKIREEDYEGYRKLVPKSLHNYFYKIKNEMID